VVAALDTHTDRGLSQGEPRARLDRYGRNELTGEKPVPARRKFRAQFPIASCWLTTPAFPPFLPDEW
jgi:magnesium-transporting ATPase (P-type)